MEIAALRALAAVALIAGAAAGLSWFVHHERDVGRAEVQAKWDTERAQLRQQVADQQARNRDLQRAAELRYTVVAQVRDRFITKTVVEVRNATDNLAACRLSADAVRLLDNASHCAGEDRAASCGADAGVQPAR